MRNDLAIVMALSILPLFFSSGAFASPLNGLSEAEQSYHDKVFDYTMDTVNPDNKYDWASYSGNGSIKVGKPFISKSSANCREFTEDYTVQGTEGKSKGYGCKRAGGNGWCRLKSDEALTCALEQPAYRFGGGSVDMPSVNMPNGGIGAIGSPNVNVDVNINTPNVDTSNIHAPHLSGGGGNSGGGGGNNNQNNTGPHQKPDVKPGEASGTAYTVTDTLGSGAAKGTGMALGWFQDMFR